MAPARMTPSPKASTPINPTAWSNPRGNRFVTANTVTEALPTNKLVSLGNSSNSALAALHQKRLLWPVANYIPPHERADVAELADALDSKSGTRKGVWVRPPPSAPPKNHAAGLGHFRLVAFSQHCVRGHRLGHGVSHHA